MAVRSDVTFLMELSPRLIVVADTSTEITVQDLHDTISDFEDSYIGAQYPRLILSAGKEDLGGSVTVGITSTLQNAQIYFEARSTPVSTGLSCDTNDTEGVTFYDAGADFVADNVERGDVIYNTTTAGMATIIEVVDLNTVISLALSGGSRDDWQIGDTALVYTNAQCDISGGNLVAVNNVGASIPSTFESPFTQIVRTSSSSATLQELSSIQYSSFNDGVTVDVVNGVDNDVFPSGTGLQPVDNIPLAMQIAVDRGFNKIYIIGNITLDTGDNIQDMLIQGQDQLLTTITVNTGADVTASKFEHCTLTGVLDGGNIVQSGIIENLNYINGYIWQCLLNPGTITLGGDAQSNIMDCWSGVPGVSTPVIDMGGSGQSLGMRNYSGGIKLINKSGADNVSIDLSSGNIILDSTVTNGIIVVRGVGTLIDNSTGTTVNNDGLMSKATVADAVADQMDGLKYRIESLNPKPSFGKDIFWAPYDGDDGDDGLTKDTPVQTFAQAHSLVTAGNNDVIFGLATDPGGTTTSTEAMAITKDGLRVSGSGENFVIDVATGTIVDIQADYVGFENFKIIGGGAHAAGEQGIKVLNSKFFLLKNLTVEDANDDGVHIEGCERGRLENLDLKSNEHYGLHFYDSLYCEMYGRNIIHYNGFGEIPGDGIFIEGTSHGLHIHTGTGVHGNARYGINMGTGTQETYIHPDTRIFGNGTRDYIDSGTENVIGTSIAYNNLAASLVHQKYLIESLGAHGKTGDVWFWSPFDGDDGNDGKTIDTAVATFAQAHALVTDNNRDVIYILANDPSGTTTVTEKLNITKSALSVHGQGKELQLIPTVPNGNTITISGDSVNLSRFDIQMEATSTSGYGLSVGGNNLFIEDMEITGCYNGVELTSGDHCKFHQVACHHNTNDGMYINGTSSHTDIVRCHIGSSGGSGIIVNLSPSYHEVNILDNTVIHANEGYGINIQNSSRSVHITGSTVIFDNTLGNINDEGASTYNELLNYVTYNVYIDTEATAVGNGSQGSPFNNLATAIDFAETHGFSSLIVYADIILDRQLKNFQITGIGSPTVDCNGKNLDKSEFKHCKLEGTYLGVVSVSQCTLLNNYELNGNFDNCGLDGDLFCVDGSNVVLKDCASIIPGLNRPTISMNGVGTVQLSIRNYSGGMTIKDCNTAGDTTTVEIAVGSLTFDNSCTDGEMVARGVCNFVDETTGATVYNETLSIEEIQGLGSQVIRVGTAAGPGTGNNQIEFDANASSQDGAYDPSSVSISEGTGRGQGRLILQYEGSTKIATVDRNWKTNPDATSKFVILAHPGREHVNEGLAQGGTINTITLNELASSYDDVYIGQTVFLRSGIGEDQACKITEYNGTTKIATVCKDWKDIPDTTTGYVILPTGMFDPSLLINNILSANITGYIDKDTLGGAINFTKDIEGGKWEIIDDQMIFYKSDNTTEVARFNLFDKDGVAITPEDSAVKRERA